MFKCPGIPKKATKTTGLLTHFHATINTKLNIVDIKWEAFSGDGRKSYFELS